MDMMMSFPILVVLGLIAVGVFFVGAMLAVRVLGQRAVDSSAPSKRPGSGDVHPPHHPEP